jgi:hypothetical protein
MQPTASRRRCARRLAAADAHVSQHNVPALADGVLCILLSLTSAEFPSIHRQIILVGGEIMSTPLSSEDQAHFADKLTLSRPRYFYGTRRQRILHFVISFIGWWIINSLLWLSLGLLPLSHGCFGPCAYVFSVCFLPANVAFVVVMAFRRRWIALGALAAFAVNLAIAVSFEMPEWGIFSIPFFVASQSPG